MSSKPDCRTDDEAPDLIYVDVSEDDDDLLDGLSRQPRKTLWRGQSRRKRSCCFGLCLKVWACAWIAIVTLLLSTVASAGPITPSNGDCLTPEQAPDGLFFEGADFLLMVFHDPDKGCAPTTRNPTLGFTIESTTLEGLFRVEIPKLLLAGACGHLQIDWHERIPGGLSQAPGGLLAMIYDTEVDCVPSYRSPPHEGPPGVPVTDRSWSLLWLSLTLICVMASVKK